jgi:hypothetical protein
LRKKEDVTEFYLGMSEMGKKATAMSSTTKEGEDG